jgi:hypothetical protein
MRISAIHIKNQGYIRADCTKQNKSPNISFGIGNCAELKTLFSYGLPCMYTGVEMIDPQKVQRLIKTSSFKQSAQRVIQLLEPYESQILEPEKSIYNIIKEQSAKQPQKNLQQILKSIESGYKKHLRSEQAPIFEELKSLAEDLPDKYKYRFNRLMGETYDKLKDRPIEVPFNAFEFQYRLEKIRNDIKNEGSRKELRGINKMVQECSRLEQITTPKTIEHQKKVVSYIELLSKKYELSDNEQIAEVLVSANGRLNGEKMKVPFSRKAFIYDLKNILEGIKDSNVINQFIMTATKLPSSKNSLTAGIIKYAAEPSEKIAYRILWPAFASVEHIVPQSCGGKDEMANFGGATTKENSERQSIKFTEQLKRRPDTPIFCQKYVDRLIKYVKTGVFSRNRIDTRYIDNFTNTIRTQSEGQVNLDLSELTSYREKGGTLLSMLDALKRNKIAQKLSLC